MSMAPSSDPSSEDALLNTHLHAFLLGLLQEKLILALQGLVQRVCGGSRGGCWDNTLAPRGSLLPSDRQHQSTYAKTAEEGLSLRPQRASNAREGSTWTGSRKQKRPKAEGQASARSGKQSRNEDREPLQHARLCRRPSVTPAGSPPRSLPSPKRWAWSGDTHCLWPRGRRRAAGRSPGAQAGLWPLAG